MLRFARPLARASTLAAGSALACHQYALSDAAPQDAAPPQLRTDGKGTWQTQNTGGVWEPMMKRSISDEIEKAYQTWPDDGGRVSISSGFSVDFELWSSAREAEPERARPLRRVDGYGKQTHPPPGKLHPYDKHLIMRRQKKEAAKAAARGEESGISNENFWKGFLNAFHGAKQVGMGAHYANINDKVHELFDFRYNEDWRFAKRRCVKRGGEDFITPVGYKGFGVRVLGKYDNGDNSWLRMDGGPKEWAVAYHGTSAEGFQGIVTGKMKAGAGQAHEWDICKRTGKRVGEGIYCTPHLETAEAYASSVTQVITDPYTGNTTKRNLEYIMQCRVKPSAIRQTARAEYWVINDPEDIRPYKVLVRDLGEPWWVRWFG